MTTHQDELCYIRDTEQVEESADCSGRGREDQEVGEAEAISISSVGKAEAERMRLKAEAYQQYGDAAKTALVLEALPKVNERFSYVIYLEYLDRDHHWNCTWVL